MAGDDDEATPAGWYRQADRPDLLRWWDGEDWTDDTMPVPGSAARVATAGDGRPQDAAPPAADGLDGRREDDELEIVLQPQVVGDRPAGGGPAGRSDGGTRGGPRTRPDPRGAPGRARPWAPRPAGARSTDGRAAGDRPGRTDGARSAGARSAGARSTPARAGTRPGGGRVAPARARDGGAGRLAQPPSPATAATALRITVRAAAIAVLVAIAWIGFVKLRDADPGSARTLSEDPTPVTVEPEGPDLAQVVLGLADLPRGWSSQANATNAGICDGRVPETVIVPTGTRSATFTQDQSGAVVTNTVDEFGDEGTAKAFLDLAARVIDSCREHSQDGSTTHLTPLDFPRFGDDTFAAALSGDSPTGSIRGELVYVRTGSRVASVVSLVFTEDEVDHQLAERLAGVVAQRLGRRPTATSAPAGGDSEDPATIPGDG